MPERQTVEIWSPAATSGSRSGGEVLRFPRLDAGDAVRVAYLDNVKPNTAELLELVDRGLRETFRVECRTYRKEYGAGPALPGTYEEIARTADLAVVGTAD